MRIDCNIDNDPFRYDRSPDDADLEKQAEDKRRDPLTDPAEYAGFRMRGPAFHSVSSAKELYRIFPASLTGKASIV